MTKALFRTAILVFTIFLFLSSMISRSMCDNEMHDDEMLVENARGRVVKVLNVNDRTIEHSGGEYVDDSQLLEVRITEGRFKNQIITANYSLSLSLDKEEKNSLLKSGDEVLVTIELDKEGKISQAYIYSVVRDKYLLVLVIIFAITIIIIGGKKGVKTIITLILTVLSILYIILPLILKGFDPMFVTIWVCIAITCITLLIVSGVNKKSLAAAIGTTGGVIAAGLIAQIVGFMSKLTGLGDQDSQLLLYIPQNVSFDFKGLLFAGIIIGALGASMDVGLSLSSAMFEIKEINPDIKRGALIRAGMNIGRDMMATMSNTLILAYTGGSLQMLLLFMAYKLSFTEIINQDAFASEIVRSLAGSIGLILTIPITAAAAGLLCESRDKGDPHY